MDSSLGVIIGKFNPPHKGHEYLVEVAQERCTDLYIFLCSAKSDEIPGVLRLQWMRELFPQAEVVHVTEENPAAARGQVGAHKIWAQTILEHLESPPQLVFASEHYGWAFAQNLGAEFIPVDIQRSQVPVSSSEIRRRPLKYTKYLPTLVQNWYQEQGY